MRAPPGYGPDRQNLLGISMSLDLEWSQRRHQTEDGALFVATIEEARTMIPKGAVRLPFVPHSQFIELWENNED